MAAGTNPEIEDRPSEHRFVLEEGGALAQLVYSVDGNRLVLEHTEVPDALGGRGLGGHLVRAAIGRAERDGLTIAPWCPYARKWLTDHPDATGGITIDWAPPPS